MTLQAPSGPASRPVVSAGGYVFVSTLRPQEVGTNVPIARQTADVFRQLKTALEGAGSSLGQLCAVQVSLRTVSDFVAMNTAYAEALAGVEALPTRTTVVSWMPMGASIEISAVAVPNGARREALLPSGWARSPRPYSYIIKTADLVFFSGLLSRRGSDDAWVAGSPRLQTQTIMDNAGTLLEAAGLTYDDVVAARVYLASPYDFEAMNEVYGAYFPKNPPARATAVVDLMSLDANVEITFVASQQPKQVIGGQAAGLPVSAAIQAGPRVWVSGVIGDTEKHRADVAAQARDIFARMQPTLAAAGLGFGDVVDTTVYLRDTVDWPKVDAVMREVFAQDPPARTATGARLAVEPALVEVLLMASVKPVVRPVVK